MANYILKRAAYLLLVLLVLSFLVFAVYNMLPADKAADMAMQEIAANKNLIYAERYLYWQRRLGLDGNLFTRYLRWLGLTSFYDGSFNGLFQGNLGTSVAYGKPVAQVIKEPLQNTVFLNIFAAFAALSITMPLGIFCARKKGSKRDLTVQVGTIVGYSMPVFITALLFIWLFAVKLDIFPVSGMTFCSLGGMTRYVRAAMLDALKLDCIRTARAKGLREGRVVRSHAWRNALIPIVALVIGWLLGIFSGSIMIENIFGINGIGKVYFEALTANDNEIVLAMQMFYIFLALVGNLLVDLAYGLVDPRIRVSK